MLSRIPAPYGDIETAAKSDCVVHHHDFLMMRRASGQIFVQTKANAPRRAPPQGKGREQLAFERVKHRVVPHQEMHRELRPLIDERGQQVNESFRISIICMPALAHEAGTAVQVPTDDEHGRARLEQRLSKRPEIVGAVDQNRGAPGPLETPDISVWCKNHKKPVDAEPAFRPAPS